jgi:mediator of RNA polymerase II transcription subunit 6
MYFLASPFCDPMSNNKVLENQSAHSIEGIKTISDRHRFEAALRTMTGIEYMVVDGPDPRKPETHGNPVWVIRKHRREKQAGQEDKVTILGTYFCMGERIYQAPSLEAITSSGLAQVYVQLTEFFDTATRLQHFSSAEGHKYIKSTAQPSGGLGGSADTSRAASPVHEAPSQPSDEGHRRPTSAQGTLNDDQELYASFMQTIQYGDEYMDENPLVGEPGSFVFSQTQDSVRTRQAKEKAEAEARKLTSQAASRTNSNAPSPRLPPIKSEGLSRKGTKATSPLSATVKLKRRKSKAPASPEGSRTPKSPS